MISIGCMFDNYYDPEFRLLSLYGKNYEIRIFSFIPEDIDWNRQVINGMYIINDQWQKDEFPFPDAVYNRCYSNRIDSIKKLESFIGQNKIFNHMNWLNKWNVHQKLVNTDLKDFLPFTKLYRTEELMETLNKYKSLFIKPCNGNWGRGVYKIELSEDNSITFCERTSRTVFGFDDKERFIHKISELVDGKAYLIQSEIPMIKVDNKYFDIRFMLQKDINGLWKASGSCSHIGESNSIVTNVCSKTCKIEEVLSSLGFKPSIIDEMANTSIKVAEVLDKNLCFLGEISIDLGLDSSGKHWLIEVNGKPAKEMFRYLYNQDILDKIYTLPIEFAYYLSLK